MNSYLLNRSFGLISPWDFHVAQTTRLVHCLEAAPSIRFNSRHDSAEDSQTEGELERVWAHKAGVNVLAIDQYEGRYMFSGGADPSIHIWDLEGRTSSLSHLHQSTASVNRQSHPEAHTHAITSLSIYPFDPTPSTIITTSHDTTLKLSSVEESSITPVHTFSLESTPYSHSFSAHPASTLLIAVGTSGRTVRLLDLRSGLSTHSLPGHDAAIPSVAWAPHNEHILASASADNRVIIFDIRRGGLNSAIATLDMDDAVGVLPPDSATNQSARKAFTREARAHNGVVTGVRWTSDGNHLVTSGQDARIRIWDAFTGANTLVHFGPRIRNSASPNLAERAPLILPNSLFTPGHETLLWPNYNHLDDRGEIFMFELREGTFIKQLKLPGISSAARQRQRAERQGQPTALSAARINSLAWRGNGGSGEGMEMFSAHGDGTIKAWVSQIPEEEEADDEDKEKEDKKRKRDVLEEVYRGLMEPTVTFT